MTTSNLNTCISFITLKKTRRQNKDVHSRPRNEPGMNISSSINTNSKLRFPVFKESIIIEQSRRASVLMFIKTNFSVSIVCLHLLLFLQI